MRILISTHAFYPSIGGLESVVSMLAHEFVTLGHEVKLVTQTPSTESETFLFEVVRRPSFFDLLKLLRWSDVYLQNNVTLRLLSPLLLVRRPWVVTHHGWYTRSDGSLGWQDSLKRFLVRFATSISVSESVAKELPVSSMVIPNPYRDDLFRILSDVARENELIFLGRLVSDKGVDILIQALFELKKRKVEPRLTIVGDGPEKHTLDQLLIDLDLTDQVRFMGSKGGDELVSILNQHEIMVVPSRWNEPFGVVALEGIACGCIVVGSSGGGLKDAIGPCGETFENGDLTGLTNILWEILSDADVHSGYKTQARSHLERHEKRKVALAYLDVLTNVVGERQAT